MTLINHDAAPLTVVLKPVNRKTGKWHDLASDKLIGGSQTIRVTVPARGFRAVEFHGN